MTTLVWKKAGLAVAIIGTLSLAEAGQEQGDNAGKGEKPGKAKRPNREEMLKKYDADGDGQLNEAERATMREEMKRRHGRKPGRNREEIMKKYDADGDGQLSEAERAAMRKDFEQRKKPDQD